MKKTWIAIAAAIPVAALLSVVAWQAVEDDSRRQGALGSGEAVALAWRGDYSAEVEYQPGDVVSIEGATYVAAEEKLAEPTLECVDCGWALLGSETTSTEESKEEAAPPEPVVRGYERVTADPTVLAGVSGATYFVTCPAGKMPLSGGASPTPPMKVSGGGLFKVETDATGARTGTWGVQFDNTGGVQRAVTIWAICALVD
jgi:hypothetical protein